MGVSLLVVGLVVPVGAGVQADEPTVVPAVERAAFMSSNTSRCVAAPGGSPGDVAVVNITNTAANGNGYGALRASGTTPVFDRPAAEQFSSVNFAANTPPNPNLAVVAIGSDGKFCYDGAVADHHAILDLSAIIPAANINAIEPTRILDSRGGAKLRANSSRCVSAPGGLPGDVAVVNITNTAASGTGYGALRASGTTPVFDRPAREQFSSVNFAANTPPNPNLAVVTIGSDGKFCYDGAVADHHVILDLSAIIPAANINASDPTRLIDTRLIVPAGGRLQAPVEACFDPGSGWTAGDVVIVNITNTDAAGIGYGAVRAMGTTPVHFRPPAEQFSSVNFAANTPPNPNLAVVTLGASNSFTSDTFCYDGVGANHNYILDVAAVIPAANIIATEPTRILDTRRGDDPPPALPPTTQPPASDDCENPPASDLKLSVETDLSLSHPQVEYFVCGIQAGAASLPGGPSELVLLAFDDREQLAQRTAEFLGIPVEPAREWFATSEAIAFGTRAIAWNLSLARERRGIEEDFAFKIGAHEWYHTYMSHQFRTASSFQEPVWMIEATAEWFALEQTAIQGYGELSQRLRDDGARYGAPGFEDLSLWETYEGLLSGTNYELLPHVGDVLIRESSRTAFLRTYWEARAVTTEPWQTTFAEVFGIEVPEFYAKVKQHMLDIQPSGG